MSNELVGLTDKEIELLRALVENNVRFLVVGMGAAILQSAPGVTQDLDLWFAKKQGDQLSEACQRVGVTYYWRNNPPKIAGPGVEQIHVSSGLAVHESVIAGFLADSIRRLDVASVDTPARIGE